MQDGPEPHQPIQERLEQAQDGLYGAHLAPELEDIFFGAEDVFQHRQQQGRQRQ